MFPTPFLFSLHRLSLERANRQLEIRLFHTHQVASARRLYDAEVERIEDEYEGATKGVVERLLEGVEERRRKLIEEKEGEGVASGESRKRMENFRFFRFLMKLTSFVDFSAYRRLTRSSTNSWYSSNARRTEQIPHFSTSPPFESGQRFQRRCFPFGIRRKRFERSFIRRRRRSRRISSRFLIGFEPDLRSVQPRILPLTRFKRSRLFLIERTLCSIRYWTDCIFAHWYFVGGWNFDET